MLLTVVQVANSVNTMHVWLPLRQLATSGVFTLTVSHPFVQHLVTCSMGHQPAAESRVGVMHADATFLAERARRLEERARREKTDRKSRTGNERERRGGCGRGAFEHASVCVQTVGSSGFLFGLGLGVISRYH